MIGRAVKEPVLPFTAPLVNFSTYSSETRGTLQQTAVEIEHVTRVGFTARRTAQQQGNLTISHGLL